MAQLRQDTDHFTQRGAEIVVVGPEDSNEFRNYWRDNELSFFGLPDPTHSVLKLYGQQVNLFKFGRMPAQAIIDKEGTVRFVHYGKSMADIPDNETLLDLLDEINNQL
jgi:peroxiredoxin Q/BCP